MYVTLPPPLEALAACRAAVGVDVEVVGIHVIVQCGSAAPVSLATQLARVHGL